MRRATLALALTACSLLAACATPQPPGLTQLQPVPALLVGEQHDAPEHQQLQAQLIQHLIAQNRLGALLLEMAEQGHSTQGLPPDASPEHVRQALHWREQAWPWARYAPSVMAAVRAGVPVLGANWPRAHHRQAMADAALDAHLPPAALTRLHTRIRQGHCNALPEAQIAPMARIQIARDRAMAQTLRAAQAQGRTAVLLAGGQHVHRQLGVPQHLPPDWPGQVLLARAGQTPVDADALLSHDVLWPTPPVPERDYCAHFRR